jgi:hypothetical protein
MSYEIDTLAFKFKLLDVSLPDRLTIFSQLKKAQTFGRISDNFVMGNRSGVNNRHSSENEVQQDELILHDENAGIWEPKRRGLD